MASRQFRINVMVIFLALEVVTQFEIAPCPILIQNSSLKTIRAIDIDASTMRDAEVVIHFKHPVNARVL